MTRDYQELHEVVEAWAAEYHLRYPDKFADAIVSYSRELIEDFADYEVED